MTIRISRHEFPLPWAFDRDERSRLRALVGSCLTFALVAGLVLPFLPVPEVEREELEELPPQLARIMLDKPEPVIPPPPPKPEPEEPEPEEPEPKPEAEPQPEPEAPKPEPEPEPVVDAVADAKEKAAVSGLLAFQDAFADMRETVDVTKLEDTGAIARGEGEVASVDRALLTSKHGNRSAGVNVAQLSRETGGVALAGRQTTKVDAPPEEKATSGGVQKIKAGDARQRSIEEIRRIFDTNKGAIFAIYNRALRQDPTLQGKVVLELVIDPSGAVVDCRVVASELADDGVVAKIVNRVRLFNFGRREVGRTTISYPVHFLPS